MAATYDPTEHPLLSAAASALEPEALDAYARMAERALGLRATSLQGHDYEDAQVAVVRQINLQLRIGNGGDITAESKGSQSITYAEVNGQRVMVDALALTMARQLVGRLGAPVPRETEIAATW